MRRSCCLCVSCLFFFLFLLRAREEGQANVHVSEFLGDNQTVGADERFSSGSNTFLAVGRERQFGGAGVSAVDRPVGLAVTNHENSGCRHGCAVVNSCARESQNAPRRTVFLFFVFKGLLEVAVGRLINQPLRLENSGAHDERGWEAWGGAGCWIKSPAGKIVEQENRW